MAMRKEKFQAIQSKMKYGSPANRRYYAIVEGKVSHFNGEKNEWKSKQFVVGGAENRLHAQRLVDQFITANEDQIKDINIVGIYRENR